MCLECFLLLAFLFRAAPGTCRRSEISRAEGKSSFPPWDTVYTISTSPLIIALTGHTRDTGGESFCRQISFPFSPPLIAGKCHSKIQANPEERSFPHPCLAVVVVPGEVAPQVPACIQHFPGCLRPPPQQAELQQH